MMDNDREQQWAFMQFHMVLCKGISSRWRSNWDEHDKATKTPQQGNEGESSLGRKRMEHPAPPGWHRAHGGSRSCSCSTFPEGKGKRKGCMYHEIPFCLKMNAVTTTLRQVTVSFCPGDLHFSLFQFFFLIIMSRNGPKIHVTNWTIVWPNPR